MQVKASLKNYRRSARKVREIARLLRGMKAEEAAVQLMLWNKGASEDILKLLKSAVANAQNNFKLKEEDLYIEEIKVNEGATMKRWRARAFGRATQILKRTCHVELTLGVEEKPEAEEENKEPAKSAKSGQKDSAEESASKVKKAEKQEKSSEEGK